jgi:tetratricopeptide (TPR) repeat protein
VPEFDLLKESNMNRFVLLPVIALFAAMVPGCFVASSREVVHEGSVKSIKAADAATNRAGVPGCLVAEGDALMVRGDYQGAIDKYAQAVVAEPGASGDQGFLQRVIRARAALAMREGDALAEAGQWDKAVLKYLDCPAGDSSPTLRAKLDLARKQAAAVCVGRVTKAMNDAMREGRPTDRTFAMTLLPDVRMALNYDPANTEAKMLLAKITEGIGLAPAPQPPADTSPAAVPLPPETK